MTLKVEWKKRLFDETLTRTELASGAFTLEATDEFLDDTSREWDRVWNEVLDTVNPAENEELVASVSVGLHLETMAHNSDEGWCTYGEDPGFGMWDYSGPEPRRIKKIGEE